MKAKEIMTRAVHVVTPDEPVSRAAVIMAREDVGMVPVVDEIINRRVIGVITDRDIAVRHVASHHGGDCAIRKHMTNEHLVVAREDDHVHDVMERMSQHQVRRVPVVDERHRLVGVIAQADLALRVGPEEPGELQKLVEAVSTPLAVSV